MVLMMITVAGWAGVGYDGFAFALLCAFLIFDSFSSEEERNTKEGQTKIRSVDPKWKM